MPFQDRFTKAQRAEAIKRLNEAHELSKKENGVPDFDPCLVMFWGTMGSGKSLAGSEYCAQSFAHGIPVFHNDALLFGSRLNIDRLRRLDYHDCIILIDEIEEYLNTLRANSNLQMDLISALIAIRHNGVSVVTTGQYEDEINFRAIRRAKYSITCEMVEWDGMRRHIVYKPHQRGQKYLSLYYPDLGKYMKLYNTRRTYVVGAARASAANQKARKDAELTDAIWQILQGCAENNITEITSAQVQITLKEHHKIESTVQMIGRRLGSLNCEQVKGLNNNSWKLPPALLEQMQMEEAAV